MFISFPGFVPVLMPLVGGVWCGANRDRDVWVCIVKSLELPMQDVRLSSESAAGNGQDWRSRLRARRHEQE